MLYSHLGCKYELVYFSLLEDAEGCLRRSQEVFDKIADAVATLESTY
jgi:hypothetical protein